MHFFMQCISTYTWYTHTILPTKKKRAHFRSLWHHGRPRHEDRCRARGWHPFSSIESGGLHPRFQGALLKAKSFSWEIFVSSYSLHVFASIPVVLLKVFQPKNGKNYRFFTIKIHKAPLHDLRCTIQHLSQQEVMGWRWLQGTRRLVNKSNRPHLCIEFIDV